MVQITSSPQARQNCMDTWLRRQHAVGHPDQVELPNGGRVSGLIEVWAGDAMANDHLLQTEIIANLPGILLKKSATDNYRSSSPPLLPQLPRSSRSG